MKDASYNRTKLMWASFLTLVASGVGFAARTMMGTVWEREFNIGALEFGQILGAGFLGFGIMIFFGGIITEKLGYKLVLVVAFLLHLTSAIMLFGARPLFEYVVASDPDLAPVQTFRLLFWSCFLFSIAQGLYEAVINPLISQLYPENPTHYLNILHAGWPAGMILGGLIGFAFVGTNAAISTISFWEIPLTSFAVIVLLYAILALPEKFPPTVATQTKDFEKLFACFLSPVFLLLMVLHACIGYVELGVDSWVTKLMVNVLPNSILILVYTSFLMFILRFFAGPIVHKINPIGLLFVSSILAFIGLYWLGATTTNLVTVFAAATVYTFGKAFFWPTMLGVAGERFPRSGAVAMGALGAMGMLTVGLLANPAIGYKQSSNASRHLKETAPETFDRYQADEDGTFMFLPEYRPLIPNLVAAANDTKFDDSVPIDAAYEKLRDQLKEQLARAENEVAKSNLEKQLKRLDSIVPHIEVDAKRIQTSTDYGAHRALTLTSYVPAAMAVGYLILVIYFVSRGGYRKLNLDEESKP